MPPIRSGRSLTDQSAVLTGGSTADWTVRDLRERIEEVRSAYVRLLADWPAQVSEAAS